VTDSDWQPSSNRWLIAVTVTLAAFMEVLDTTIVNVSLPHIAGTLSASYDEATWALTSYLVANSIVLPISAFFGRLIGRKRYFVICIAAFTVCSFLCGIATNLTQLVIFRVLQGFFGGGLQPNQQSIILDTFPPAQRGRAFALTAAGRLDHGQLQLALGVLHQRAHRRAHHFRGDQPGGRPAMGQGQIQGVDRLHRDQSHRHHVRVLSDHAGPGRGR
jgi:MFS family permease